MKNHLFLVQLFGAGNPKINKYLSFYGNAEKCVEAVLKKDRKIIGDIRPRNLQEASMKRCDDIIDYCEKNNIRLIAIEDKDYPEPLKNIYDPPIVLFCDGDISCFKRKLPLAVVGPRKPDVSVSNQANYICNSLSLCGFMLVSGLAFGIDSIAHNACILNNVPTAAVLACGMDIEYPFGSRSTREKIKKAGGVIITEMLPGVQCTPKYFHIRNRIISGISYGTLVVGGYNKSGSMITARHAFEQDRDLFFTLPHDTMDPAYSNIIKYLRDGALPAYDHNDIINEYTSRYPQFFTALSSGGDNEKGDDDNDNNSMPEESSVSKVKDVKPQAEIPTIEDVVSFEEFQNVDDSIGNIVEKSVSKEITPDKKAAPEESSVSKIKDVKPQEEIPTVDNAVSFEEFQNVDDSIGNIVEKTVSKEITPDKKAAPEESSVSKIKDVNPQAEIPSKEKDVSNKEVVPEIPKDIPKTTLAENTSAKHSEPETNTDKKNADADNTDEDDDAPPHFLKDSYEKRLIDVFNRSKRVKRPKEYFRRFGLKEAEREMQYLVYLDEKRKKKRHRMTTEERALKQGKREFLREKIRILSTAQNKHIQEQIELHKDEHPTQQLLRKNIAKIIHEGETEDTVHYFDVTPSRFLIKPRKRRLSKKSDFGDKSKAAYAALYGNNSPKEDDIFAPDGKKINYYKVQNFIISKDKVSFEEIINGTEIEFSELTEILTDLELDDKIVALPGSRYSAILKF